VGDAACHLDSVCLSCGRFIEAVGTGGCCPHCDEPTDGSTRPGTVGGDAVPVGTAAGGEPSSLDGDDLIGYHRDVDL
jgi:hypothetical protein